MFSSRSFLILILGVSIFAYGGAKPASVVKGTVIGVLDGDTIEVMTPEKDEVRIRLLGIDAPEARQSFYKESKESLTELIFNKKVEVKFRKKDQYGRVLGKVELEQQDINLEQIMRGMAWHYKYFEKDQDPIEQRLYANAEALARKKRAGLWKAPHPTPPWRFRRALNRTKNSQLSFYVMPKKRSPCTTETARI